ncbi:MAG TPA: hypothetical protein VGF10_09145 [Gaiella sp.]
MGPRTRTLTLTIAALAVLAAWPAAASAGQVCWPGVRVPPVELPALTIPAKEIPARELPLPVVPPLCIGDICSKAPTLPTLTIPAITIPAVTIPAVTIPGYTVPERCFDIDKSEAPPPSKTTVRVRHYEHIDSHFSLVLSVAYWRQTGKSSSVPNYTAEGFGEANAAGAMKNQYVRSYLRDDGTFVPGHWRRGGTDGRPTCKVIRC